MSANGPMASVAKTEAVQRILGTATRRAAKWMSFQSQNVSQMQGQVGGISKNKRPMMSLAPDYVLKHVRPDHRGYREVAFYEAVKVASNAVKSVTEKKALTKFGPFEMFDMLATWLAICVQDPVVTESEEAMFKFWHSSKKESELLKRLSNSTPSYYGVVHQDVVPALSDENYPPESVAYYILMQDLTAKFSKPCAIDIKMGTHTYEPDATEEKCLRECSKYSHQSTFGMRIVSMRMYDPSISGYRSFPKTFGRGLKSRAEILSALELFFTSEVDDPTASALSVKRLRTRVVANILMQLRLIRSWFKVNDCLAFYASSLLLIYEGDFSRGDATTSKMIDFGHVRRQTGGDPGYELGLSTLISLLTSLLNEADARSE